MKKLFTFIAAVFFSIGALANTYVISNDTYVSSDPDNPGKWTFTTEGQTFTVVSSGNKTYGKGVTSTGTFKVSQNDQIAIQLPDGMTASKVIVTGYSNSDENSAYIKEFCGTSYNETAGYDLPANITGESMESYEFTGSFTNVITITPTGNQACIKLEFEATSSLVGEKIFWNFSDWTAKDYKETYTEDGLTIHAASDKVISIDKSNKTIEGVKYTQRLKFGGTGAADRCISFTVDGPCTISVSATSGSSSADRELAVYYGNSYGEKSLGTIAAPTGEVNVGSVEYKEVGPTTIWIGPAKSAVNIYFVRVLMAATDAPVLASTTKEITLSVNPLNRTAEATFSLTGINLTDGTYSLDIPDISGLSVSPSTFTISDGNLNQEFTATYTSEEDADEEGEISFELDGKSISILVTCKSKESLLEQTVVSEERTWDWEKDLKDYTIELNDETRPSKNDEFVLANYDVDFPKSFDAQALVVKGEYPLRDGCTQNTEVSFQTTTTGVITVDFSDTGNSGGAYERYLTVNGEKTEYYTMRTGSANDRKVSGEIAVQAGKVSITGSSYETDITKNGAIRIYKITFTPKEIGSTPTAIQEVQTAQTDGAAYNLAGQRVANGFKGVVVKDGKKMLVK